MQGNLAYPDCLFKIPGYLTNYIKQLSVYPDELMMGKGCLPMRVFEIPNMWTSPKAAHSII